MFFIEDFSKSKNHSVKYDLIKDKIMKSPKIEDISFKDNETEKEIKKTLKYGIIKKLEMTISYLTIV